MFLKLFLAFTLIPVTEIYLLIKLGGYIGTLNTVLIVIVTGVVGAALAKSQGIMTLIKIQKQLSEEKLPAEEMIDGILILVAGIVLLTPGFLTDMIGLIILFPLTRKIFKNRILSKIEVHIQSMEPREIKIVNENLESPEPSPNGEHDEQSPIILG